MILKDSCDLKYEVSFNGSICSIFVAVMFLMIDSNLLLDIDMLLLLSHLTWCVYLEVQTENDISTPVLFQSDFVSWYLQKNFKYSISCLFKIVFFTDWFQTWFDVMSEKKCWFHVDSFFELGKYRFHKSTGYFPKERHMFTFDITKNNNILKASSAMISSMMMMR